MKRILSVLLLCALLLTALAACGNQPDETTPVATTPAATTPTATTPADTTPVETTPTQTEPPATTPAQTEPPISMKLSGEYRLPEEAPLTEEERVNVSEVIQRTVSHGASTKWWEGSSLVLLRHQWRYYGRVGDALLVVEPAQSWEDDVNIYAYYEGTLLPLAETDCSPELYASITQYHEAFQKHVQSGTIPEDPLWYGGWTLPKLETCPYSVEQIRSWFPRYSGEPMYCGTYHGYAAFWCDDYQNFDAIELYDAGGVVIIEGPSTIFAIEVSTGEVYLAREAYTLGILTTDDLRTIAGYCYGESCPYSGLNAHPVTAPTAVTKGTHTSPDMHPLTDLEQAEIENAWLSQKGYRIEWYSDGRTETRHYGWRYYGRIERAILLARPIADGQSGSDLQLLVYESGEFINYEDLNYEDTLRESVERFYKDFEESILRREDLDDPYDLSGQDLPPLGECPYTEEDLSGTGFHPSDYLGTYNGYSVFKVRGVIRGMSKVQLAGVPFWWGDFYLFYAYKDGESITIDKAFNLGILTYYDLRAIAYYTYGDYFPDPY